MSDIATYREPDRSGPVVPVESDGQPMTAEEAARLDAAAQFWRRPDVQMLVEQREREERDRYLREQSEESAQE